MDVRSVKGEKDAGGGEGVVGGCSCSGTADITRILRGKGVVGYVNGIGIE
jgi:hypothetical protein